MANIELGEDSTQEEAEMLFEHMKKRYPEVIKEFQTVIFTAYKEYPALATKQYKLFRVILTDE